jgi:hypothetical protein
MTMRQQLLCLALITVLSGSIAKAQAAAQRCKHANETQGYGVNACGQFTFSAAHPITRGYVGLMPSQTSDGSGEAWLSELNEAISSGRKSTALCAHAGSSNSSIQTDPSYWLDKVGNGKQVIFACVEQQFPEIGKTYTTSGFVQINVAGGHVPAYSLTLTLDDHDQTEYLSLMRGNGRAETQFGGSVPTTP